MPRYWKTGDVMDLSQALWAFSCRSQSPPPSLTLAASGQKMLRHFACRFGALRSGILQIWKMCQNQKILRNLKLFSDLQYSTSKCSKLACKVTRPGKCWNTLHADLEHLKVEYFKSENSARILRSAGIWHFFQNWNILLLSAPKLLTRWVDMLHPGTHTQILTALGRKMLIHFACNFGALRNRILQIWNKC